MANTAPSAEAAALSFGGEMELSPGQARAALSGGEATFDDNIRTVTSGRTGLKLIAETIAATGPGTVLLPAYLCPSILQPFREQNLPLAFYGVGEDLAIDTEHLRRQVTELRPRAVLVIHYFGFPVVGLPSRAAAPDQVHDSTAREAARPPGTVGTPRHGRRATPRTAAEDDPLSGAGSRPWLIEDCVQGSWMGDSPGVIGDVGDFVLTSFRKYLPVPDGGLVLCRAPGVVLPRLAPAAGGFVQRRMAGKVLRHRFLHEETGNRRLERAFLDRFQEAEAEIDHRVPRCGMSRLSLRLLNHLDIAGAVGQRRDNFRKLLGAVQTDTCLRDFCQPLFTCLPEGVSPLAFPVRVRGGARDRLRRELAARRVFCPVHWALPEEVRPADFPQAHAISADILSIPIDQRYNTADMQDLLHRLNESASATIQNTA